MATTQLLVETRGGGVRDGYAVEQIDELLPDHGNLVWLDLCDPGPAEVELLRREFGFHELALEDVSKAHQRPKCDTYRNYYFIVVYAAAHTPNRFIPMELQLFWGGNYVVTVHRGHLDVLDEARKRWEAHDNRRRDGVAYLVYSILDSLVDAYFPLMDWVAERVEDLEEIIFARPGDEVLSDLFQIRRELLRMRRLLAPTRDVLNEIVRRDLPLFPQSLRPYFGDVYDHSLRVLDGLDVYRDLLASALDLYLSATSTRLNQTMKRMTALTLVVIVPTLIAGIYGMNFDRSFFPASDWDLAFPAVTGVMAAMMLVGVLIFRRLDWL
jgi:magnesium transporter